MVRNDEVVSSIPTSSTKFLRTRSGMRVYGTGAENGIGLSQLSFGCSPGGYRVSSLRMCLESFSTRLSFSIRSLGSKPRFTRFTSAGMEAESSASS